MQLSHPIQKGASSLFAAFPFGFWLATLSSIFYFFAIQMTFPIIPLFITDELGAGESFLGTTVLAVTLAEISLRLPAGVWADRQGRLRWIQAGAFLGVLYPFLMALSVNNAIFLLGRAVHGLSLAVYVTILRTYIADIVPAERRGEAFGINTSAFSLALIFGPLTGEYLQQTFGFGLAFWVSTAIALACFALTFFLPSYDHDVVPSQHSLAQDVREVISTRGTWAALLAALSGTSIFTLFFVFFPLYADELRLAEQAPRFFQTFTISMGFSLFAIMNFITLPMIGRFSDQRGRTLAMIPGIFVLIPALILHISSTNIWLIYLSIVLLALGFGFFRAIMDALIQDATPRTLRGTGTAVLFTGWAIGIGLQSQIFGIVLDYTNFHLTFAILGVLSIVFGLAAIWLSGHVERERVTLYKGEFPPI